MRKEHKLTGKQLGDRVNLTQSQISKIENGYLPINAEWVNTILDILKAPKRTRQQVAHHLSDSGDRSLVGKEYMYSYLPQGYLLDLEQAAKHIRNFTICAVPVHAQTMDYRMALSRNMGHSDENARLVLKEMTLRQDAMLLGDKKFHLIVHEAALYTVVSSTEVHLAQLDRLDRMAGTRAYELGVIPIEMGVTAIGISNFVVYDEQVAIREVAEDALETRKPEAITQYLNLFHELSNKALYGPEGQQIIRKAYDHFANRDHDLLFLKHDRKENL